LVAMIDVNHFIKGFSEQFADVSGKPPWEISKSLAGILQRLTVQLEDDPDYHTENGIAIHRSSVIEQNVVIKAPAVIGENCFVAANSYLRDGVYLGSNVKLGPGCEIKSTLMFNNSSAAHFNYIGDSIVGSNVNFEAGAVVANHYNERAEKMISVCDHSQVIQTNTVKFGALVGDDVKIGANAVLSPGTILLPGSIVKRLELIEQAL
jgi:UDP-N-acetylglucosamine diphosphorylase / glucose-1-phosphate thymidylyltransferase / UDP-N-acetylgalactosamine diphosphorylase / glucosamine-1-phosphate N-acetyltransferase / galactosamine-1-phosphate N-acetyltransferase